MLSRWENGTEAGGAAAVAEWFVHSYSPPVCQLLLDHNSASIVPGSVVLSKLRGDRSRGKKERKMSPKPDLSLCPWGQPCSRTEVKTNMDSVWLHKHSSKKKRKKNHWPCFKELPYFFKLPQLRMSKERTPVSHHSSRWLGTARLLFVAAFLLLRHSHAMAVCRFRFINLMWVLPYLSCGCI